jgi:Tfp pilus assembly protein PilV
MASTPARSTPPDEAGFALIEVVVSALIAVMVTGAVITLLNSTGRASAEERHRSQAFSVAQEDQARLRATRITDLNVAMKPRTVTLNGTPYTVTSSATFVSDKTSKTSCTSGSSASDYVKLGSKVTWPSMGSRAPIVLESIVSPVSGSLDPTHGNLAVTVVNAKQEKISGAGLSATGVGAFSGSTDSEGCALFGGEPAGAYTLTPNLGSEYVNANGEVPPSIPITITAGTTTPLALEYDRAGSVEVNFKVKESGGTGLLTSTQDSLIAFNTGMKTAQLFGTPGGTEVSMIKATSLFPFAPPNNDSFYAGSCTTNAPGAGGASVSVPPGGNATATVQVPALYLTVKNSSGTPAEQNGLNGAKVTVTDSVCKIGATTTKVKRTFTTNPTGNLPDPGLPWGKYELCAWAVISGKKRRTTTTSPSTSPVPVESLSGTTVTMTLSTGSTEGECP